jgi:histidine triad (HIT) family protein
MGHSSTRYPRREPSTQTPGRARVSIERHCRTMRTRSSLARLGFGLARTGVLDPVVRLAFASGAPLLPVRRIFLDQLAIAFFHPRPSWPTHVLLVPRRGIASYRHIGPENVAVIGHLFRTAPRIADLLGLGAGGYSLLLNGGARQDVGQLHVHLVAPPLPTVPTASLCAFPAAHLSRDPELLSVCAWLRSVAGDPGLDKAGFSLLAPQALDGPVYLVTE